MTCGVATGGVERPKRALVTGGTGFIGSHLVRRLAEDGWDVHVLSRAARPGTDQVHYHLLNVACGPMATLFERVRPSVVFHLATCFTVEHRPEQIRPLIDANLLLGAQILEGMVAAGCLRMLNTGTAWQHMEASSRDYHPANLYAATKQAFEALVDYYCEAHGVSAISLKIFDTYGPADRRPKLLNLLAQQDPRGPSLELSAGEQRINLVHVRDVVEAMQACERLLAVSEGGEHLRYMLGGIETMTLREVVHLLELAAGRPFRVKWGAKPYRAREIMEPWTAGVWLPGWRPQVSLREGLRDLLPSKEPHEP